MGRFRKTMRKKAAIRSNSVNTTENAAIQTNFPKMMDSESESDSRTEPKDRETQKNPSGLPVGYVFTA